MLTPSAKSGKRTLHLAVNLMEEINGLTGAKARLNADLFPVIKTLKISNVIEKGNINLYKKIAFINSLGDFSLILDSYLSPKVMNYINVHITDIMFSNVSVNGFMTGIKTALN